MYTLDISRQNSTARMRALFVLQSYLIGMIFTKKGRHAICGEDWPLSRAQQLYWRPLTGLCSPPSSKLPEISPLPSRWRQLLASLYTSLLASDWSFPLRWYVDESAANSWYSAAELASSWHGSAKHWVRCVIWETLCVKILVLLGTVGQTIMFPHQCFC